MAEIEQPRPPLAIAIDNKAVLYAAYMYFLKSGGLFIPTKKQFKKGDKLTLLISLPNDPEKTEVIGSVVWITPVGAQGARAPGIGVQFEGDAGKLLNDKIQKILATSLKSNNPTHTL